MKPCITLLLFFLHICLSGQVNKLEQTFRAYETVKVDSESLISKLSSKRSTEVKLSIGNWDLLVQESGLLSNNYSVKLGSSAKNKTEFDLVYPLYGKTTEGGLVSITVACDFVQGFIAIDGEVYNFEALRNFDANASLDDIILYKSKDVKTDKSMVCSRKEVNFDLSEKKKKEHNLSQKSNGLCYEIEYAIASDYSMFEEYGLSGLIARNIAILNDVNTNFVNSFNNEIRIVLNGQYISDCPTCDPWTETADFTTLLNNFKSWSNSSISNPSHPDYIKNDIASLWSKRWQSSLVVGQAFLGGLCSDEKYNLLSDFSSNANALRVLVAHELGHNFNAFHDPPGTSSIMAPNINITNFWSEVSRNVINDYVTSALCSPFCSDLPPTVYWDSPKLDLEERTLSVDEEACIQGYRDFLIPIKMTEAPLETILVGINTNSTQATENIDYKLLTPEITFTPSGQLTEYVSLRVFDDYLVENDEALDLVFSIVSGNASPSAATEINLDIISDDKLITSNENPGDTFFYGNNMQVPSSNGFFEGERTDVRSRFIILADSLNAMGLVAGDIDMIAFFVFEKQSTADYENLRLGMMHTSNSNLLGQNWQTTTTVFEGSLTTEEGVWNSIDFTNAFTWDGISNIYVEMCYSNALPIGNDRIVLYASGSSQSQLYGYSSNELLNCGAVTTEGWTFNRAPVLQLRQKANRKVENWAIYKASTYMTVGDRAVLISERDRLIASIENTGSTDLGCTEVAVRSEGNGSQNLDFANGLHSQKSYRVRVDDDGSYKLTIYYTEDEDAIWQNTNREIQFVSSRNPITAVHIDSSEIITIQNSNLIPDLENATAYEVYGQGQKYFAITNWSDPLSQSEELNHAGTLVSNGSLLLSEIGSGVILHSNTGQRFVLKLNSIGDLLFFENSSISPKVSIPSGDLYLGDNYLEISSDSTHSSFIKTDHLGNLIRIQNAAKSSNNIEVIGGYIEISEWGKGVIFKSLEGDCFKLFVSSDGILQTARTSCL